MNFSKWFFHKRKGHTATTLCKCSTTDDDKERYNNNKKIKNEQRNMKMETKPFLKIL
ncbi:MAG TPA: hypothetical protein VE076_04490 [Nitrososphaeraceae archaeon]|nr:hypothetical protein [Nitrososphaeraceae archaeon]